MSKTSKALASALPLAAALVLAAAPRTARAQLIVAPGETIDGLTINAVGRVGINDANQLVFQALCSDTSGSYNAVFVRDVTTGAAQLVVKTGDTIDGLLLTGIIQPTINDAGQVVFVGFFASGEGLFEIDLGTGTVQLLVSRGDVIDGRTLTHTRWPYINDSGGVVFESGPGVFSLTNFLASAGLNPAINDTGNVVYTRSVSGFPLVSPVDGTLVTSGDVIDGHTVDEAGFPAINDPGEVVFRGFYSGTFGIFSLNELLVAPGDIVGGTTVTSVDTPAINDAGDIAFRGGFSGGVGAFLLPGRLPPNEDPVADAGADQEMECTSPSGTVVTLDGTVSSDPDGDALTYEWSVAAGSGATIDDPSAATTTGTFPIGPTMVTLTVTDGNGGVAVDDVVITVVDTTPPVVVCTTDVAALWPPNHQIVAVALSVVISDQCENPEDLLLLCTASSNEPDDGTGDGSSIGDVGGADGFTAAVPITLTYNAATQSYDGQLLLRAERDGAECSRVYSIVCDVMDTACNMTTSSCVVVVPHDRRKN